MPIPEPDAQQVSNLLNARLRERVQTAGGWLGFDEFMHCALYEPRLGYYAGGATRFGPDGDFVTAPEISPLFGACIANACASWLEGVAPVITEFGAGTGQLAAQVLNALDRLGLAPAQYQIVELSASLRSQQQHTIQMLAPEMFARVSWLDELPPRLPGLVIANEVLDAMPVRLFELRERQVFERGLIRGGGGRALAWQSRLADPEFAREVRRALARANWGGANSETIDFSAWPENYCSEFGQQASAWLRTVGERLHQGVILLIDYGFPAPEFYHPQRAGGTLACHYRHRVHHDPLYLPGLQDITAHVDYSACTWAAESSGLDLLGYTSQANFLLNTGLLDSLSKMPNEPGGTSASLEYARQAQAVQKLVSEAEMGELFKVIAFGNARGGHGSSSSPLKAGNAFARGDRSAALETGC